MASPPPFSVAGKTAIITGAGSGINYHFAALLLSRGCNVLLADLSLLPPAAALLTTYAAGTPRAAFQPTDVTDWTQLTRMFAAARTHFGALDIVVPGAGVYEPPWSNFWVPPGSAGSRDADTGGRYASLDVNLVHPVRCAQLAIREFVAQHEESGATAGARPPKRILLVSSIAGQTATLHAPLYVAAKHALNGFIRTLAPLEPRLNIRVNGVAPGLVLTPLWTEAPEKMQFVGEADEWVSPEEVAEAMLGCLEGELGGGGVLEVGRGQTRVVGQFMDPGPSGRGHTVSRLEEMEGEVWGKLEAGGWGGARRDEAKAKL
ncbi:hypothetical protein C7974DRAFT_407282 [Boeremia exigua]|uniref:uncharacterized protein n=1 Tax=Boeremia exigua TaxID=749465 RepID=UPI001E8D866E|nr:uncharacterized protein C7974DRAFT_407282 [Boeremia exigua]KAH6643544.1 hypothetical protein C7974DRAFT_407282 [Boeremia exigua]